MVDAFNDDGDNNNNNSNNDDDDNNDNTKKSNKDVQVLIYQDFGIYEPAVLDKLKGATKSTQKCFFWRPFSGTSPIFESDPEIVSSPFSRDSPYQLTFGNTERIYCYDSSIESSDLTVYVLSGTR